MTESLATMQEQFDNATTDTERNAIRDQIRAAGFTGVANTIGKPADEQDRIFRRANSTTN